jgi:magnesium transporter
MYLTSSFSIKRCNSQNNLFGQVSKCRKNFQIDINHVYKINKPSIIESNMVKNKKGPRNTGLPPGTLVYIGEKKTEKTHISIMDYDKDSLQEVTAKTPEECYPFKETPTVTWININGLHEIDVIEKVGRHFNLHPLVLEDILNTHQRPKMEDFDDYLVIILKMFTLKDGGGIEAEQISIVLGFNFVLSFQEKEGDIFNNIRERIRSGKGRIKRMASDYLAYALVDTIVDQYFVILENLGERIEAIEEGLINDSGPEILHSIHELKGVMIHLRKSVWPLREVVNKFERSESRLIRESTTPFLRDVYDHTIQTIDTIETYRDMLSGMLDLYLSSVSNRMNEVMKVLTIIATIFIPLTFITGIYGMNFVNIPELGWRWGYPLVLIIMALIGLSMGLFFKRKKWF